MEGIISLISQLVPCIIAGFILSKINPNISNKFAKILIDYGVPISLTGLLLKTGINIKLFYAALISSSSIIIFFSLLFIIKPISNKLRKRELQLGSVLGNSGYLGIPFAVALLPIDTLQISLGYDLGAKLVCWTFAPSIIKNQNTFNLKTFLKEVFFSKALLSVLLALIIELSPFANKINGMLWLPSKIIINFALITIGMKIQYLFEINSNNIFKYKKEIVLPITIKLIIFPFFIFLVCNSLNTPQGFMRAFILQAACPTAISVFLISEAQNNGDNTSAILVIYSTIISLITIPMWSFLLINN